MPIQSSRGYDIVVCFGGNRSGFSRCVGIDIMRMSELRKKIPCFFSNADMVGDIDDVITGPAAFGYAVRGNPAQTNPFRPMSQEGNLPIPGEGGFADSHRNGLPPEGSYP